ncbi:hypothetical protein CAEBREN_12812 [Caenorhabditis brenneri]|uniref:Uncharacterized protein n=1 Tax=Caenorhabditis brenneri TaxID=135651 RepID=G0NIS8_CAEBE|nr:hypothetical protein CAEBREN_12812 [Caenorhabditis brenneri]
MSSSPPNKFYTPAANKTPEENIADFGAKLDAQIRKEQEARPPVEPVKSSEQKAKTAERKEIIKKLEESTQRIAAVLLARKRQRLVRNQLNIAMRGANKPLPAKRARKDINYFKK